MPVNQFIASVNSNDVVTRFMESGEYAPRPSVATISNAMDVGDPSNFIRIEKLHDNNFEKLKNNLHSYSFTDDETREAMRNLYDDHNYIADPHGAIGYLGIKKYLENNNAQCIFLETAHPIKFLPVIDPEIVSKIEMPEQIKSILGKEKLATKISVYEELKSYLLK